MSGLEQALSIIVIITILSSVAFFMFVFGKKHRPLLKNKSPSNKKNLAEGIATQV